MSYRILYYNWDPYFEQPMQGEAYLYIAAI